jgi:undecaprenyl-diphosphatase
LLPKYTETLTGNNQEPISVLLVAANDQEVIDAFRSINWYQADTVTFLSVMNIARAALFNAPYVTAPMTPSFWDDRVHDFGFQKPTTDNSVRTRHHARIWRTKVTINGKFLYVGVASEDSGIKWLVTHRINADIDAERDYLVDGLLSGGMVATMEKQSFVPAVLGKNFAGDQFFSNGQVAIIYLK